MAAIVSRVSSSQPGSQGQPGQGRSSARKNRVARVSAKAAQRQVRRRRDDDEERTESDAMSGDVEVAEPRPRPDNATYLSMYFRDMAALDVLQPEQEFTSARELEALEIVLWEAVLAFAPAVEHILAARGTIRRYDLRSPCSAARRRARASAGSGPGGWSTGSTASKMCATAGGCESTASHNMISSASISRAEVNSSSGRSTSSAAMSRKYIDR